MEKRVFTSSGLGLLGILFIGLLLRISAFQFGLPHLYHADEPIVINHALAYGTGDLNPHFFKIPPLISYAVFLALGFSYLIGNWAGVFHSLQDFEFLFYRDPTLVYLIPRLVFGVLLGTATIFLLYRLIKTHFGESHGLIAAFLFSICFLHVRDSHYIYADIPLVVVLVAAFFPIWKLIDKENQYRIHLSCGAMIGLATAVKYNGIALVVPYLAASFLAAHKRKIFLGNLIAGIGAAVVFTALNPYWVLDFQTFWNEISAQSLSHGFVGWAHHFRYSLTGALGMSLLLTAVAGMMLFHRYERKRIVTASFIVFYYLLITLKGQAYDRYVLPLIPFLIFFAADFLWFTAHRIARYRLPLLWAITLIVAAEPLYASVLFDRVMAAWDTRTLAKEWVETNVPSGTAVAIAWEFHAPRLRFSENQIREKMTLIEKNPHFSKIQQRRLNFLLEHSVKPAYELYFLKDNPGEVSGFLFAQPGIPYDLNELRRVGVKYVILPGFANQRSPQQLIFEESLQQSAVLVAAFSPYRSSKLQFSLDPYPLTAGPFLLSDLMQRERSGLLIRIYQLN